MRNRIWHLWNCVAALLGLAIVVSACNSTPQPVSIAPTPIQESSSSTYAGNQAQTAPASVSVPPPAISVPAPAVSVPAPASSAPAVASSAPANPYGPPTLDERIFFADAIAIVRPISAEAGFLTVKSEQGETLYSPVIQSRLAVLEYLKGDGDSEIIVEVNRPYSDTYSRSEQAIQTGENNLDAQTSRFEGDVGVVFLALPRYSVEVLDTSLKTNESEWMQYDSQLEIFSADGDIGSVSTTFSADSSSNAAADAGVKAFSIDELRERIEAMEALLKEGEDIEGWEECIESMLLDKNSRRKYKDAISSVFDVSTSRSGLPSGIVVHDFSNKYPKQWFTGDNAHLFHYGDYQIATTRPIPAGGYEVRAHFQMSEWVPCDYVPTTLATWRYNFESAEGTLHEAFFDPVDIGGAVGADGASGVLKPASFTFDGSDAAIERIAWRDGQVQLSLSPRISLADHHIDFIALDGSVALRLDFDDAVERVDDDDVATLAWGVCEQPWVDGDLLMLRIAESIPNDGVAATNEETCLASDIEQISVPAAVPTPEQTETPKSKGIATPTPTSEPTHGPTPTATIATSPTEIAVLASDEKPAADAEHRESSPPPVPTVTVEVAMPTEVAVVRVYSDRLRWTSTYSSRM